MTDRPSRAALGIQRVCGLVAIGLGVATLAGWLAGWRLLTSIRPGYIPMAPNTALSFILLGFALAIRPGPGMLGRRAWSSGLIAAAVATVAALRLSEYATGIDLGVDRMALEAPSERLGLAPVGKMALSTAIGFLLAGVALVLATWASRRQTVADCVGGLGVVVAALGLIFTLGYLYNAPLLYGGAAIPMALNTAAGMAALGLGLVAVAGVGAFPLRAVTGASVRARLLRAFLPFVVGAVVGVGWLTHAVATSAGASSAALAAAFAAVGAVLLAALICDRIARHVGGQLERAEAALRRAHDELELRVIQRTHELLQSKALVEERNRQLQRLMADLEAKTAAIQAAHRELQRAECQLVQSEKLASLGQLVAGVAHEINNPLAFVINNVAVLQREVRHLAELVRLYRQADEVLGQHRRELLDRIVELAEAIDLDYVLEHLDSLVSRSREGLRRIQQIVKDFRDFARLDEGDLKEVDLNPGLATTVQLIRGKADERGVALATDLGPLPPVTCYPAKVNQVALNLLANAIDACAPGGHVSLSTRAVEDGVEIVVTDDGQGIDPAIRAKIFDPFFTTKPIGQGTGLGLAISYGIVQA
ncbi:MAG: hypothetical protein IRY99_20355, partial [Isosphaeraceae bacterium]|nr:hypothetical protein [Isosphaeraceae bacterium]